MSYGWRDVDWVEPDDELECRHCALYDGGFCLDRREEVDADDGACDGFEDWRDEDGFPIAYVLPPLW